MGAVIEDSVVRDMTQRISAKNEDLRAIALARMFALGLLVGAALTVNALPPGPDQTLSLWLLLAHALAVPLIVVELLLSVMAVRAGGYAPLQETTAALAAFDGLLGVFALAARTFLWAVSPPPPHVLGVSYYDSQPLLLGLAAPLLLLDIVSVVVATGLRVDGDVYAAVAAAHSSDKAVSARAA